MSYTKDDLKTAYDAGCPISWSDFGVKMKDENFRSLLYQMASRTSEKRQGPQFFDYI